MPLFSKDTADMPWCLYEEFLLIHYDDIKKATNNFADVNLLKQGSTFKVYKGQLLQSSETIDIVARICPREDGEVSNEISYTKYAKHKNIVSTFKYNYDNEEIIINKYEANGSLDNHLRDPTLTWMRRLHICVGVAHALKYLYYEAEAIARAEEEADENNYIIHGNIKSSNILLDHNWEPKLNDFECGITARKHHLYITDTYNGSLQHMDPAYVNTKGLTHKSDIFSFGVLLFEVLFGKEAFIQKDDNWYFARLARSHYENSTLDALIDPDLRKQMNLQSLNIFAEVEYYCLKEQRSDRPDINRVILKLEKAMELQHKHEHPTAVSSNHLKVALQEKSLSHLKLRLADIESATNNFSEKYCIGSGGFAKVYKAKLEHFDYINSLVAEGKNEGLVTKKHSTVAIY